MDLTSPLFLFFFLPTFVLIYIISSQRLRLPIVLLASVIFLTLGQVTALLWLGSVVVVGYALGQALSRARENGHSGKALLWLGVGLNIGLLSFFKFTTAYGRSWLPPISGLAVPIGLSFVTFQMISYLVDVWRGNTPAEKNFLRLGTYLLFFPKLVSGPLLRYKPFAEQLDGPKPSTDDIVGGLRRLLAGFIKRILIANQLAPLANAVFNLATPNVKPLFAWLALLAFTLQIYFDFSGYTDMAIGLGLMIGIRLPENFNYPYISQSASEFWRRWHITLSTWFREYVFFPLERHRLKWAGQQINIVLVFLLTGLWHGFKPTFIIWGLIYGVAIAFESAGFGRRLKNIWRPLRHLYTLAIVMAGWVFFRSDSLSFASGFFLRLAGNTDGLTMLPFSKTAPLPFIEPSFVLALFVAAIFALPLFPTWNRFRAGVEGAKTSYYFVFQAAQDILLIAFFVLGLAAVVSSSFAPNLYAKF
jgi:alginate O-acetyltransferase complex protein AlgI